MIPGPDVRVTCPAELKLDAELRLAISTPGDDLLGGLTPDETALVWTTEEGGALTLHHAEAASPGDFADAGTTTLAAASPPVTLSADGLQVIFVDADGKSFSSSSRARLEDPFGTAESYEPAPLGPDGVLPAEERYSSPVLAADGLALFYARHEGQESHLFAASRMNVFGPWSPGAPLLFAEELTDIAASRLLLRGAARDGYTVFLRDEDNAQLLAGFLDPASGALSHVVDLGDLLAATTNATCERIYYSRYSSQSDSVDLFSAQVLP